MSDELKRLLQEQLDTLSHPNPQLAPVWDWLREKKIEAIEDALHRQQVEDRCG